MKREFVISLLISVTKSESLVLIMLSSLIQPSLSLRAGINLNEGLGGEEEEGKTSSRFIPSAKEGVRAARFLLT